MNGLRFQVLSDVHLEIKSNQCSFSDIIQAECDVLILAGDICNFDNIELFLRFMEYVCSIFKVVLYVFGNHEFFNTVYKDTNNKYNISEYTVNEFKQMYISLFSSFNNLVILDNEVCSLQDDKGNSYTIAGSTLWCAPNENNTEILNLQDFKKIKIDPYENLKISSLNKLHYHEGSKLYHIINQVQPDIVITHFPPISENVCDSRYKNETGSLSKSEYFMNTLLEKGKFQEMMYKKSNVTTWIYGHTHFNSDFQLNENIRIISNQFGTILEREHFRKDFVFEHIKKNTVLEKNNNTSWNNITLNTPQSQNLPLKTNTKAVTQTDKTNPISLPLFEEKENIQ